MKPKQEKLILDPNFSFVLQKDVYAYYPTPWHYHPEYELVLVVKSTGKRIVGNHEENFSDGDLVFMGPNLPHWYQNDPIYHQGNTKLTAEAIVIHFNEDFLGKDFFNAPEMADIRGLFKKSTYGLKILGKTRQKVALMMNEMFALSGYRRILHLLDVLEILALSEETIILVNHGYLEHRVVNDHDRIAKVYDYIMDNFKEDIGLAEVAAVTNMSLPSFCRFFKSRTRKAFSSFLNEIRIGYACKLLMEERDYSISQICYECGFNNMSNFNRQFKKITNKSPLQYKQQIFLTRLTSA